MIPSSFAQSQAGGVGKEGSWYVGEGLKHGDFFSYKMCHVDYKECTEFEMDMWIKGDIQSGSETKWLAEVVVYDGRDIIVGEMELGKIAPEPTGGSEELGVHRGAFKSSVAWLSAFATSDGSAGGKGPKDFSAVSWGKIANIGGEQILPTAIESVTIPAGTWDDTVMVSWKTGGAVSKVWIVDEFPFPIKASTFTHVSEGIPPPEYNFQLLDYKENVTTSPFEGIESVTTGIPEWCNTNYEKTESVKRPSEFFGYTLHVFYGPEDPVQGCEMQWLIKFINLYDDTAFLNQVQYDIFVVDENLAPIRSLAQEEGKDYLYSPSGQAIVDIVIKEDPGDVDYVVWIYGLAPPSIVPSTPDDYLKITIPIFAGEGTITPKPTPPPVAEQKIPEWIKGNAGWWAEGAIDDDSFVQGIQFLIKEGIMQIPPTTQGASSGNEIPSWIKNNAGWWAEGAIDDDSFVQGIQFLIKEGIMSITS